MDRARELIERVLTRQPGLATTQNDLACILAEAARAAASESPDEAASTAAS